MARIPIAPPDMKDQRPRYTLGWRVGNTIYVAGQLPYDKDGNLIGHGDIKAQTRRVFENIRKIVEAGGGRMDDIVKITVFVTDVRSARARSWVLSTNRRIASVPLPSASKAMTASVWLARTSIDRSTYPRIAMFAPPMVARTVARASGSIVRRGNRTRNPPSEMSTVVAGVSASSTTTCTSTSAATRT